MRTIPCLVAVCLVAACSARGSYGDNTTDAGDDVATTDVPTTTDAPKPTDVPTTPDVPVAPDVPAIDVQPIDVPAPDVPAVDVPADIAADLPAADLAPADTGVDVVTDVPPRPCLRDTDCLSGSFCNDATARCTPRVCVPDSSSCVSATRIRYCDARGAVNTEIECPGGASCTAGRCDAPASCTPGAASCASPTTRRVCNTDGMTYANTTCPAGTNGVGACTGMGVCGFTCMAGFGDCDMVTTNGCETALSSDSRNCGACGTSCPAGRFCSMGACVAAPTPTGTNFQVNAMMTTGCRVAEHVGTTGSDRGGIAVSSASMFYTGTTSTARFDLDTLANTTLSRVVDGLVSNLHDGTVYTLASGTTPITRSGGTISALIEIDGTTGAQTTRGVTLSMPIAIPMPTDVGIFSGYDRAIILGSGHAYNIELPSGRVTDMGPMTFGTHQNCANWAVWGVAEFFAGALYVDYVQSPTTIVRARVPDGMVSTVASFTNLANMCSFTVSPTRGRWYFHHQGISQFGGSSQTAGYCGATLMAGGTILCPSGQTMCTAGCADLQSDRLNCGTCGNVCPGTMSCVAGACSALVLYHGFTCPIAGCSTTSYNTTAPTNMGGRYPYNTGDSNACRAWKLAATVCPTAPTMYSDMNNWTCANAGGFTDPVFGTYCRVATQYACSTCPGACNAACLYTPLSLRNCAGSEASQP